MDEEGRKAEASNEARRISLVDRLGILDTPADERFDVFTRLAASVTGSPVSTISLIDEKRVWFKSSQGMPEGLVEVPRDFAACSHLLHTSERVLVIPDATKDSRVSGSPLVTGHFGMRFYAGVALCAPTGEVLGSLCIIDHVAREVDQQTIDSLVELADGVSGALRIHERSEHALKDALTGLGNSRMFDQALASALTIRRNSYQPRAVGLILLDLDRFSSFNDMFGPAGGDAVLREVAQCILSSIRVTDVAARLGSDEFAIIATLPDGPNVERDLREIAERILANIRTTPMPVEAQRLHIEASLGIAIASPSAGDMLLATAAGRRATMPADLMLSADVALHNAKRSGRNCVATSRDSTRIGSIGSKLNLNHDLRQALTDGSNQLSLVLQPLRSGHDGTTIRGFEALVRWTHPKFGSISPADFVPVAERSGLAYALDNWVLREACRINARFPEPRARISVNVTPSSLLRPDFLTTVDAALADSGLTPGSLCIEVTERAFRGAPEAARQATDALIQRGIQVALDDFRAGAGSFGFLTDVSVSKVKLDGSLVNALQYDCAMSARAMAILRKVVATAHARETAVVAEGVETMDQMRILQAFGVDEFQGWYTGRPAPAAIWLAQVDVGHATAA